ncbi:MAG TPA: hypothetical protein VMF52_04870 [Steroidobacteraceae bacterium]|nr:hypothetical protein [Steroidobacteraceae bacterium]
MIRTGESYRVDELVPHRGRLSLLGGIVAYGADWLHARVVPAAGDVFADARGVPGWVGVEYMAQAASAFGGIEQVQRGERPSIGLLIGTRYYRCTMDYFDFGTPLDVHVKIAMRDDEDFAAYDCRLALAGRDVAECTLKAYRPRDLGPLLAAAAHD